MKIAIPLFGDRVSPHFGVSSTFLFVETNGATIYREAILDVPGENTMEKARRLANLGVEWLICGGIQNRHKDWLTRKGIMVLANQKGVAKEVVHQHLRA